MSDRVNRQWRLKTRPVGMVKESDFEYVEEPAASPGEGQALVRNYEWYLAHRDEFRDSSGVSHRVPWKQGILKLATLFF